MQPQQPHFPQRNNPAQDETPTTIAPPPRPDELTRPPVRRAARPTIPIQPPTLPGLEDEVRSADAEVRSAVRSMALAPVDGHGALAPAQDGHESTALLIRGSAKPPHPAGRIVPRRNGPRSFLMQFIVAMVASVVLVSALTLTTPLGQEMAAATGGQFAASSSLLLFAPTPTATPKPKPSYSYPSKGVNPGTQVIINEITAVFGSYAQGALNIAKCESGYDPNAVNSYPIGNSHASGVFQILYPSTWNTTSYAAYSPFDYDKNIRAAYEIFHRDGNSWREWACKPY
jgi:transglycosylase-like protein with SLT domain